MDKFGFALVPLAAFWASFNSLLAAAKLVNELRDKVISGRADGMDLSTAHRKVILADYRMVMFSSVIATWMFAGVIGWAGFYLSSNQNVIGISYVLWFISLVEVIFGCFFIWCGILDHGAMREWQHQVNKKHNVPIIPTT